jgi:hypothetical protein
MTSKNKYETNQKLQCLTQGFKSVNDYYRKMEVAMIWANIIEKLLLLVVECFGS